MTNRKLPIVSSILCSILGIQSAHAVSSFSSSSFITFSIEDITNHSYPGDLAELSISGGFRIEDELSVANFGKIVNGNADSSFQFSADYFDYVDGSLNAWDNLTQSFSASGTAIDGSVESLYQASGYLRLENNSARFGGNPSSYTIDFSLEYEIHSDALGELSSNEVTLNYYSTQGYDYPSGTEKITDVNQSLTVDPLTGTASSTLYFSKTLDANEEIYFLHADTSFRGKASTVAPVPIPAASWLFLSGLVGIRRFKYAE